MRKQAIAVLGVLALALGLAGPVGAAEFVDITYDLSDTTLTNNFPECPVPRGEGGCTNIELLGASMKIRYTSDSASSMPILHGLATLQSLALSAQVDHGYEDPGGVFHPNTTARVNVSVVSPVIGSLLSGGTLTFGTAQIRVTGSRHCHEHPVISGLCIALAGTLTSIVGPLGPFTTTEALSFAASPGAYGGGRSTPQTVSGTFSVYAPSKVAQEHPEYGDYVPVFASAVRVVGREILREAPGHDPKPIPEPGTLLLLGAGAAGLALVSRATRRSRQS